MHIEKKSTFLHTYDSDITITLWKIDTTKHKKYIMCDIKREKRERKKNEDGRTRNRTKH